MSTVTKTKKSPIKTKAATKPKTVGKAVAHPSFQDIIKECIIDAKDRSGVSRITIKKFVEEKYKLTSTPTVTSNINRAITTGAEKGVFVLPKGPSGKVKLAPKKSSSDAAKENAKPVKATAAPTKPVKKPTVKKTTTTKAALKPTKPVKKTKTPSVTKKTVKPAAAKKTSTKRSPAKKSITGTAKAKAVVKPKAPTKKKTTTTKRKPASPAKPASKAAAKPASKK